MLVSTDVAAMGLDVDDLNLSINIGIISSTNLVLLKMNIRGAKISLEVEAASRTGWQKWLTCVGHCLGVPSARLEIKYEKQTNCLKFEGRAAPEASVRNVMKGDECIR